MAVALLERQFFMNKQQQQKASPQQNEFGEWLETAMRARGLNQKQFAAAAGIGQSTVSSYISGARRIERRERVEKLARALVPERLDTKETEDEIYRRILNTGLRAAGLRTEDENGKIVYEPFLEQIREAGVIEDLPPETQAEILDFLRFKSQQAQRKRDGE